VKRNNILFICFRQAILNDFNSRLLCRLINEGYYIDYLNFEEYLNDNYRRQFSPKKVRFILINKSMSKFLIFRKLYNVFLSIFFIILFIISNRSNYKYIFAIDYQFNILLFLLEFIFLLERKRVYILQEMYQYAQYPTKYSKFLLKLDSYSQNFAIAVINRNQLREDFVNKLNPFIYKKHFTVMNINDNFKYIRNNDKIENEIKIIYAGGIRKDFFNFLITMCEYLQKGNLSFNVYVYGFDNIEIDKWSNLIDKRFSHLKKYLSLNPKVDNDEILSLYTKMNLGIIYYPKDKFATINEKLAAPCKVFEYINTCTPFVSFGSLYCDYLIDKYQIGIKVNTFKDMADLPGKMKSNYIKFVDNIRKLQMENIFSFDKEFDKVRKFLKL